MNGPRAARAGTSTQSAHRWILGVCSLLGVIGLSLAVFAASASAQEPTPLPGPVDFAFVVDTSGSMFGEPLDAAGAAGRACLDGLPAGSAAAVVGYASRPTVLHPLSTDRDAAARTLDALIAVGNTATHDALIAGSRQFGADPIETAPTRSRYVVLLSDGSDTASQRTADDALAALAAAGARLWVVAIETGDFDLGTLDYLAEQSSGALIRTGPADLVDHCTTIADDITAEQQAIAAGLTSPSATSSSGGASSSDAGALRAGETATVDEAGGESVQDGEFPAGDGDGSVWSASGDAPGSPAAGIVEVPLGAPVGDAGAASTDADFPLPPPQLASAEQVGASTRALWIGAAAVFASMTTMFGLVFVPSHAAMLSRRIKVRVERTVQDRPQRLGGLGKVAGSASGLVESIMNRRGLGSTLNDSLDAAGVNLRPSEYVAAVVGLAIAVSVIGSLMANPIVFVVGLLGVPLLARQFLKTRSAKRTKEFQDQLVETLMIMAGSVRAGHGLMQSINSVAEQASEPTSTEFGRVITEVRIGRDPIDSLRAMAARVDSLDLTWTVRAMALNRELGGNLAEILDNVADTIRERNKIADQVRALSAEGKFSAYVLFCLPFGVVFAVRILNPEYIAPLFNTNKGLVIIAVSLTLMSIGAVWIRKMIQIEY